MEGQEAGDIRGHKLIILNRFLGLKMNIWPMLDLGSGWRFLLHQAVQSWNLSDQNLHRFSPRNQGKYLLHPRQKKRVHQPSCRPNKS